VRGTEAAAHVCAALVCTSPKSRKIGIMSKITFVWKLTVFSNRSRRGDGPAPTRECSSPDGTGPPDRTRRRYRRALSRRSHGRPRWRPSHARPRAHQCARSTVHATAQAARRPAYAPASSAERPGLRLLSGWLAAAASSALSARQRCICLSNVDNRSAEWDAGECTAGTYYSAEGVGPRRGEGGSRRRWGRCSRGLV
jgi:hypothetical protein